MRTVWMAVAAAGWMACGAGAATLRMNFVGGANEVTLTASETVDVELWIDLIGGETLAGVQFSNGPAMGLNQTAVVAVPANWSQAAVNGPLGLNVTEVSLAATSEGVLAGASSQLLGRQTIQATAELTGSPVEITFVVDGLHPALTKESGADFTLAAAGSADAGRAGFFSIGSGSPAYIVGEEASPAQPLIVHPASAGGGGTGGGNTNDNTPADGNVNVNDNAAGNTNDNTPTDGSANDNTAANDNSDGATDGTADTDDDGLINDVDPDDDNDGIVDDQDNTPQGEPANDNAGNDNTGGGSGNGSSSGGGGSRGGVCGLGMLGAMPIGLAGMGAMAWRRKRGED